MVSKRDAVEAFQMAARQFCQWSRSESDDPLDDVFLTLGLVVDLYGRALRLPINDRWEETEDYRISPEEWKGIYDRFCNIPETYYSEVLDPLEVPASENVIGCVADDLADIYRDVSIGLKLYDSGRQEQAVRLWRKTFISHWGTHALSAIRALHHYLSQNDLFE